MAGIGFAGQGYTSNKNNLAQKDRRAGYERRKKNYAERDQPLTAKQPTANELAAFRHRWHTQLKKRQRQERVLWLVFGLLSAVIVGWFFQTLI